MVYRGRPSTGCKKCRQRKIKCDERAGGCFKCEEKNFTCPGYDRSVDRFFRDETATVEVKAKKAKTKALIARDERHREYQEKSALKKLHKAISMPLLAPLADHAITFFMHNFAWGLDEPPTDSKYFNQHLSTYGFHPIVATSMTALGLAGVSNIRMDSKLKHESTKWYTAALKMTNDALRDPVEITSDNTLLATIILSVYETTTNERTFSAWAHHVTGSSSLLRMRGRDQFATPAGRRMWLQTVGLLTLQCLGAGQELPGFVHEMSEEIRNWDNQDEPNMRFYHLHIQAIDFRAQVLKRQLTDLAAIVDRALELDKAAQNIFEGVNNEWWGYEVKTCEPGTPGVFGTTYHVYSTLSSAQTWDWVRYNRIYLHDIIRNALITGLSTSPPVFAGPYYLRMLENSTQTLYQMQAGILASIPQYLQTIPADPTPTPTATTSPASVDHSLFSSTSPYITHMPDLNFPAATLPDSTPFPASPSHPTPKPFGTNFPSDSTPLFENATSTVTPTHRLPIIRISGGFSSLWSLYIAGATPIASAASQQYVIGSLRRASREFGIKQASLLAGALEIKIELDRREREGLGVLGEVDGEGGMGGGGGGADGERGKYWSRRSNARQAWSRIAPVYMPMVGPHVDD